VDLKSSLRERKKQHCKKVNFYIIYNINECGHDKDKDGKNDDNVINWHFGHGIQAWYIKLESF
jgi:hypothetical protein